MEVGRSRDVFFEYLVQALQKASSDMEIETHFQGPVLVIMITRPQASQ